MKRIYAVGLAVIVVAGGSATAYGATAASHSACAQGKGANKCQQRAELAGRKAPARPKDSAALEALGQAKNAQDTKRGVFSASTPARTPGISDDPQAMFSPMDFTVQNMWQGSVQGTWEDVFAGEIRNGQDPVDGHPGVRVQTTDQNGQPHYVDYQVPGPDGSTAKIASEAGGVLTIVSSDGTQSRFDMRTNTVQ
ncbi:MAG: hypothetical protein ACRDQ6_17020 [Pseudonocardiaceae bacterium]